MRSLFAKFRRIVRLVIGVVNIEANFDFFNLRGDIAEDDPVVDIIRVAIRQNKRGLLQQLEQQGIIQRHHMAHNLVATVGRNVIARLLVGDTTYTGAINYGALGTSSTTPNNSDTQLGTEVYRKLYASRTTDGNNVSYIDFFYAATDTNGTYTEFGNVIDGTASANTGRLFSHILTGGWVKTNLQSMFVSAQYTIS
jgi:hypothetical protein